MTVTDIKENDPQSLKALTLEGSIIVSNHNTTYPPRCVKCNAPTMHYIESTFAWHPPWAFIAGGVIFAALFRKRAKLNIALCEKHSKRLKLSKTVAWRGSMLSLGLILIAVIGITLLFCVYKDASVVPKSLGEFFIFTGLAAIPTFFISLTVGAVVGSTASVKTTKITDSQIWIAGTSQAFRDALKSE